ncbi:MAG: hypothetical protein K9M17_04300 [Mariprofundaceae bacterium]|nr:hypothetical protein [Mariprofundaceae bacterium]
MRSHPLIRHPVGKMPAAARWYLAAVAVLTLLLIATHFAIQVYAQQEARRLVNLWSESAGISVEDVRYRMLRGALTLVDLRLNGDVFQLYAPSLFLYGNLSSFAGDEPAVTRVAMRGLHVSLKAGAMAAISEGRELPALFRQLWASAQQVEIHDAKLDLLPESDAKIPGQPVSLNIIRLQSRRTLGQRAVEALIYGLDGEVRLVANSSLKNSANMVTGEISWSGMNAESFLQSLLGLTPIQGRLSGNIAWASKPGGTDHYSLSGEAGFEDPEHGSPSSSKISWNGVFEEDKWHGKVNGHSWPLAMFADYAPKFQGRKLISGNFSGGINFSGNLKQWRMGVVETYLENLHYGQAVTGNTAFPEWLVEKVHVSKAALQWPERRIDIKDAEVINADLGFDAREGEPLGLLWRIKTGEIGLNRVRPALYLPRGVLRLPLMKGSFSVKENHRIRLSLKSMDSDEKGSGERWNISGEGDWTADTHSRMAMEVVAENAALVRFRPLLPEKIRTTASDLTGSINMKLKLLAGAASWEGSGQAELSTARLVYQGEQWQAEKLLLDIEKMGVGIPEQLIRHLDVQGWRYQAALQPLAHMWMAPEVTEAEGNEAERWHLKNLTLRNGEVAVGHKEAVWMDQATVEINDLKPGNSAPFRVEGRLGEGRIALKGDLAWSSALPEISSAKISVRDVLPFFINEWLSVSGAPKLVRGRVYTDISMQREPDGRYRGMWYFRLQHGALGPVTTQGDPLLERTGFNTFDVFAALQREGRVRLRIPIEEEGPFGKALGDALVKKLNGEMAKKGRTAHKAERNGGSLLSSVRLHEKGVLSQNERVRLRKVIGYLRQNPKQSVELIPRFGRNSSDERRVERSRYTQRLIEQFMNRRGVSFSRIFPVWPGEEHRSSGSAGGISIHVLP